jgi:Fe-S cluster assembly iron-binding protein IscA
MAIVANAGQNGPVIVSKVQKMGFNFGYNAADGEFVDMYKVGIIDPAKVTRSAIQNAASIAAMVLTTECLIVNEQKEKLDEEVDTSGIKVIVENKAIMYLLGTQMDFVEDDLKSEFVFINPNSKGSCGCGESFNV